MHSRSDGPPAFHTTFPWLKAFVCLALCLVLVACGFRLKGVAPLPFSTLYTNIAENSAFGANIRRGIIASSPHTRFVSDPRDAEARLIQLANQRSRREISIDADGQVEEYELTLQFAFQLTDAQGRIILPPTVLRAAREVPYDPDDAQAKESEITMLFEDMQQSMVARVVRRLSSPDVIEAFERARGQPVPDRTEDPGNENGLADIPAAADPLSGWDSPVPGSPGPFD